MIVFDHWVWYRVLSALCVYSKFGHHPHSLSYLWAKFRVFRGLHCWASPWIKIAYPINHPAYLMRWEAKCKHFGKGLVMRAGLQVDTQHHDRRGRTEYGAAMMSWCSLMHTCAQAPCLLAQVPVTEGGSSSVLHSIHLRHYHDGRCWLANSAVPHKFTFWLKNIRTPNTLIYLAERRFSCKKWSNLRVICTKVRCFAILLEIYLFIYILWNCTQGRHKRKSNMKQEK